MKTLIIRKGLIGNHLNKEILGSKIIPASNALDHLSNFDYYWIINCTFNNKLNNSTYWVNSSYDSCIVKALIFKDITGTYNCGYEYPIECLEIAEILINLMGYVEIEKTKNI